jgi:hypothetical protein
MPLALVTHTEVGGEFALGQTRSFRRGVGLLIVKP